MWIYKHIHPQIYFYIQYRNLFWLFYILCFFECKSFDLLDPLVPFSWLWPFSYVWQLIGNPNTPALAVLCQSSGSCGRGALTDAALVREDLGFLQQICISFLFLGVGWSPQPLVRGEFQFVTQGWPLVHEPVSCVTPCHLWSWGRGAGRWNFTCVHSAVPLKWAFLGLL